MVKTFFGLRQQPNICLQMDQFRTCKSDITPQCDLFCSFQHNICLYGVYRARSCTILVPHSRTMTYRHPSRTDHCTVFVKWLADDTLINLVDERDGHLCGRRTSLRCLRAPVVVGTIAAMLSCCGAFQRLRTNASSTLRFQTRLRAQSICAY